MVVIYPAEGEFKLTLSHSPNSALKLIEEGHCLQQEEKLQTMLEYVKTNIQYIYLFPRLLTLSNEISKNPIKEAAEIINLLKSTGYEMKSVDTDAIIKTVQNFGYTDLTTSIQACVKARGVKDLSEACNLVEKLLREAAVSEDEKLKLRNILGDKLASMDITLFFNNPSTLIAVIKYFGSHTIFLLFLDKFLTRSKAAMVNVRCEEPKDATTTATRTNSNTTTTTAVFSVPLPIKIPCQALISFITSPSLDDTPPESKVFVTAFRNLVASTLSNEISPQLCVVFITELDKSEASKTLKSLIINTVIGLNIMICSCHQLTTFISFIIKCNNEDRSLFDRFISALKTTITIKIFHNNFIANTTYNSYPYNSYPYTTQANSTTNSTQCLTINHLLQVAKSAIFTSPENTQFLGKFLTLIQQAYRLTLSDLPPMRAKYLSVPTAREATLAYLVLLLERKSSLSSSSSSTSTSSIVAEEALQELNQAALSVAEIASIDTARSYLKNATVIANIRTDNAILRAMCRRVIDGMKVTTPPVAPVFSWSMPQAIHANAQLQAFLRSPQPELNLTGIFSGIQQARRFASENSKYNGYSLNGPHNIATQYFSYSATAYGAGKLAGVRIVKTRGFFDSVQKVYQDQLAAIALSNQERNKLLELIGEQDENHSSSLVANTVGNVSTIPGPANTTIGTKRMSEVTTQESNKESDSDDVIIVTKKICNEVIDLT